MHSGYQIALIMRQKQLRVAEDLIMRHHVPEKQFSLNVFFDRGPFEGTGTRPGLSAGVCDHGEIPRTNNLFQYEPRRSRR